MGTSPPTDIVTAEGEEIVFGSPPLRPLQAAAMARNAAAPSSSLHWVLIHPQIALIVGCSSADVETVNRGIGFCDNPRHAKSEHRHQDDGRNSRGLVIR
jgi:hypothetical protein